MGVLCKAVLLKTFEESPQFAIARLGASETGVACVVTELDRVDRVDFHAKKLREVASGECESPRR